MDILETQTKISRKPPMLESASILRSVVFLLGLYIRYDVNWNIVGIFGRHVVVREVLRVS